MTSVTTGTPAVQRAAAQARARLLAQGWQVLTEPAGDSLPPALAGFLPDLVAHRGDEHLVVEIKSSRLPPSMTMIQLAERIAELPGWRLDVIYVSESRLTANHERLTDRADRARDLGHTDLEAALLLAWSAVEGALHRLAETHGLDADDPGPLLAGLASIGALDDEEHLRLRRAQQVRDALAHGRQGPPVDVHLVGELADLTRPLLTRAGTAKSE